MARSFTSRSPARMAASRHGTFSRKAEAASSTNRQFRRYYLPRSEGRVPLWDYDGTLKRVFHNPRPATHGRRGRPGS